MTIMNKVSNQSRNSPPAVADDPRWTRILARDKTADGHLWYSVSTTGIYCRPSCPSRTANPKNVALHDTLESARATGFRPCKRCNPEGLSLESENAALVAKACRIIEGSEEEPSLEELAEAVGRSPSYFHRMFKSHLVPAKGRILDLKTRNGVWSGLTKSSLDHEDRPRSTTMNLVIDKDTMRSARQAKPASASADVLSYAVANCELGKVLVARSATGVCAILLGDAVEDLAADLAGRFPQSTLIQNERAVKDDMTKVLRYIEKPSGGLHLTLDMRGTPFQRRVWEKLKAISAGRTVSYMELAKWINPLANPRAVAGACAANPIALAIPCHRVVRSNGDLAGYRWGIERKRVLIEKEAEA